MKTKGERKFFGIQIPIEDLIKYLDENGFLDHAFDRFNHYHGTTIKELPEDAACVGAEITPDGSALNIVMESDEFAQWKGFYQYFDVCVPVKAM